MSWDSVLTITIFDSMCGTTLANIARTRSLPKAASMSFNLRPQCYYVTPTRPIHNGGLVSQEFILALDQGTTSSRAILFNRDGWPVAVAQQEFEQIYPQPGWVEHRPADIWSTQLDSAQRVIADCGVK